MPPSRVSLAARALLAAVATLTALTLPLAGAGGAAGAIHAVATDGDDAGPGTVVAPWRTLGRALHALQPGETLQVRGGVYVENLTGLAVTAGSPTMPVRVTAYPGEHPILQGLLWLHSPSWWTFDGLNVAWNPANTADQHMVKFTDGTHWRMTNAEVWGARSYAGILVAGAPSDWSLDHLFVHDTVATHAAGSNQDHLVYVNALSGGNGGVIERNVFARSDNGRAVKVGPSSSSGGPVGNLAIRYNTMVDNLGPSSVQLAWTASNVSITRNIMDRPATGRSTVTAYELTGLSNVVGDNLAWQTPRILDTGVAGLVDGGGNIVADPWFVNRAADDYHAGNPIAAAYGAFASGDVTGIVPTPLPDPLPGLVPNHDRVPVVAGGYRLIASDGGVFAFGDAQYAGSAGGRRLNQPMVGAAATSSRVGYWMVARDGGIFAFGDAPFLGSTGGQHLNLPIVGIASTPSASGYRLAAADGGIFAFGDAPFLGSTGGQHLNQPIVGIATTPSGNGYWLVARDGGIFAFGDAPFLGSTGGQHLNQPIVGIASTPSGNGYWLVARDGGIFAFGDAPFLGSTGAQHLNQPIVGMAPSDGGSGYRLVASDGGVFSFGDAGFLGSTGGRRLNAAIIALAR